MWTLPSSAGLLPFPAASHADGQCSLRPSTAAVSDETGAGENAHPVSHARDTASNPAIDTPVLPESIAGVSISTPPPPASAAEEYLKSVPAGGAAMWRAANS